MSETPTTYSFGPLERRGLLGSIRAGQAAWLAGGILLAIVALDSSPSPGGLLGALAVTAVAAGLALFPLAGHPVADWLPVAGAYLWRGARTRRRFLSPAPSTGLTVRLGGPPRPSAPTAVPPPALGELRIVEADYHGRTIGALAEQSGRRLTAVLACRVLAFALLDREAQERRLARWGAVLAAGGDSALRRLQWIERTAPAPADELARWVHAERDPALPPRGTPMIESYLELIGSTTRAAQTHEILLAVQVDARRIRSGLAPATVLVEETERVARGLRDAEVTVLGALSPGQLARSLRVAFDPYAGAELAQLEAADPGREGLSEAGAWPLGAHESWEEYRSDGAIHATYWISAWPRVGVSPLFMAALLGTSSAVRSVAVTFEPLAGQRSTREVEAAVTRDRADRDLRARLGQSETARQRQVREATARREAELAAGHGEVRVAGFVTVSGRDAEDLRRSCAAVLDLAARAHLELRRLYGQQAEAFTFTLPLARGLR